MLREGGEDLRGGKGDVQEEAHAALPARGAKFLAHEQEVVVVHPDDVVLAEKGDEEAGEAAVDRLVGGELAFVETGEIDAVVKDRPEGAVGEAEVVALVFGLGEVGEDEIDVALGDEPHAAGLALDGLARPAEPDAAALGERVPERHGKAARPRVARRRNAIGCNDQPSGHCRSNPPPVR